jgi:hypothetical protein
MSVYCPSIHDFRHAELTSLLICTCVPNIRAPDICQKLEMYKFVMAPYMLSIGRFIHELRQLTRLASNKVLV